MLRRVAALAVLVAAPAVLGAQRSIPNDKASEVAVQKLADLGPLPIRGSALGIEQRPEWVAVPAGPSRDLPPEVGGGGKPATIPPVVIATPAQPPAKPTNPGQSVDHRP